MIDMNVVVNVTDNAATHFVNLVNSEINNIGSMGVTTPWDKEYKDFLNRLIAEIDNKRIVINLDVDEVIAIWFEQLITSEIAISNGDYRETLKLILRIIRG